jgi:uncharacterized protein (DUF58 family)
MSLFGVRPFFRTASESSSDAETNEAVSVSLSDLVRLSRPAAGVPWHRSTIRALRSGSYLARLRGRGMEFDETRLYTPGDDARNLDWKVTARTGTAHTKLFREERERPVFFSVDYRASMYFATRGVFKSVMAARLAALLAWSAQRHGDRIGGQIFSEGSAAEFKPQHGRRAVLHLLKNLADAHGAARPAGSSDGAETELQQALERLVLHVRPGSLVFLFSDFRKLNRTGESRLIRLARHSDVVPVMLYDPLESALPPAGHYRFSDGAREVAVDTGDQSGRWRYHERFQQRLDGLETLARRHRMRFIACRTTDDPLQILQLAMQSV